MQILSDKEREELLLPEQIKDSTGSLRARMCGSDDPKHPELNTSFTESLTQLPAPQKL